MIWPRPLVRMPPERGSRRVVETEQVDVDHPTPLLGRLLSEGTIEPEAPHR